jgi:hypothetical protein
MLRTPTKSVLGLALLAALATALVFAGAALAGKGGNSANAKLCQKDGWQALMDSSATPFSSEDDCVSTGAHGEPIYTLASLHVAASANQPADGLAVSTSGLGLAPTAVVTTPLLKNGVAVITGIVPVPASGMIGPSPLGHISAPCVAGNVYAATATGTSADSLSVPTAPGIPITSNTVTRTSSCP